MNKFVERKNIDIYIPVLRNTVEKEKITVIPELNNINVSEVKGIIEEKINLINKENGEYNNSININLFDGFYSLENSEKIEVLKTIKELKEKEEQKALETKVKDFEIKVNLQYPFEEIYELYKKDKKNNNIKKGELYNFIKMISEFKVDSIILDIYSTIGYINRVNGLNYDYDDIKNVVKEIRKIRLFKKSEVIISTYIGLLESEINEDKENIQKIASLNIKTIVLSPVIILKGTEISKKFIKEEYKYLSNNELKTHITNIAVMLNEIGVKTYINHDLSRYNDDYIAGPYVKNINRIVQTEVWYEKLLHMIKDLNVRVKKIEVIVKEKEIPKIIGEEKENIKRLKELYDIYLEFKKLENLVGWDRFITKLKMKRNKCDISIRILEKYEDKYKDGK